MNIFLDTEFNGFGGDLISLALVADDGLDFYGVLPCSNPIPWVAKNVIPKLYKEPEFCNAASCYARMKTRLREYLQNYSNFNIVADWPEDLAHFLGALSIGGGLISSVGNFTTELVFDLPATALVSKVPHNALEDARALRTCYYEAYPERKP